MLSGTKTYKVNKDNLIQKITQNRDKHLTEYTLAYERYLVALADELQEVLDRIHNKEKVTLKDIQDLPKPENHTKEYDQVLGLLTMSIETEIEITPSDYSQYILDEWSWKHQVNFSNSYYHVGSSLPDIVD